MLVDLDNHGRLSVSHCLIEVFHNCLDQCTVATLGLVVRITSKLPKDCKISHAAGFSVSVQ